MIGLVSVEQHGAWYHGEYDSGTSGGVADGIGRAAFKALRAYNDATGGCGDELADLAERAAAALLGLAYKEGEEGEDD